MTKINKSVYLGIKSDLMIFIVKLAIGFGIVPIYLHFITIEEFGTFVAIQAIISILSLADIGMGLFVVKKFSNQDYFDENEFSGLHSAQVFQYGVGTVLLVIGVICSYFLGDFLSIAETEAAPLFWLFLFAWLSVVLKTYFSLIPSLLRAKGQLVFLNYLEFSVIVISSLLNIVFLMLGYGIGSFGVSLFVANLVSLAFMYQRQAKICSVSYLIPRVFDKGYISEGWDYVKKFQILRMSQVAKSSLFVTILGRYSGVQFVGLYNITNKMPSVFPDLISKLSINYFAHFAKLYEQGKMEELKSEYLYLFNFGLQATAFILLSLNFLNEHFIHTWVGDDRFIGSDIFIFMLCNLAVLLINSFTGLIVQISGDFRKTPIWSIVEVVLLLIFSFILNEVYGSKGVIMALFLSSVPGFLYTLGIVNSILNLSFKKIVVENIFPIVAICTMLPLISFFSDNYFQSIWMKLLIQSVLFTLVFLAIQWNNVSVETRTRLLKKIVK
ncbi:lipopolysaccharide biosynthesis protein [Vibrio mediterranei]